MLALNYIWEYFIIVIEGLFLIVFMDDKLPHIARNKVFYKILFLFIDSTRTFLFNYYEVEYELNYLTSLLFFLFFTFVFYDAKISIKIFFSTAYLAILFAADTLTSTLFQLFDRHIPDSLIGGHLRIPVTLLYICCIAVLVFISHFINWKTFTLSPRETILYLIVCVIGFFFGQYLVSITLISFSRFSDAQFTNSLILISSIYCLLFLLLLTYVYILSYTKEQNKKLLEDRQQLLLEEADYKNLIEMTASLREMKHDIEHHLSTILFLIENDNISDLKNYINQYLGSLNNIHKFISTGNASIDCILTTSINKAISLGISVEYTLSIPDTFNLNPVLTSALLGNLWTNAITACNKLIDNNKPANIDFYIKPIENMLLISIENTFDGTIKKDCNGSYLSTKSNNTGIGMKRIYEIVEQNDGFLEISDEHNLYCVHIVFPLKEKSLT